MQIIDAGDYLLAAGLAWEVSVSGDFRPQQISARAKQHKARQYVAHTSETLNAERLYGFGTVPKQARRDRRPVLALASLVARARTDKCAFLAPLDGNRLAFVGVLGGQPDPGSDLVGPEDVVLRAVEGFVQANGIARIYYTPTLGNPTVSIDGGEFAELGLGIDAEAVTATRLQAVPSQISGGVAAALAIGLGAAVFGGLSWHKHQQELEAQQAAAAQMTPAQLYMQARHAALAALPRWPAAQLGTRFASAMLPQQISRAGWALDDIVCGPPAAASVAPPAPPGTVTCHMRWRPSMPGATYAGFAQEWDGPLPPRYDDSLKDVVTDIPVNTKGIAPVHLSVLPPPQAFLRRDGSFFQTIRALKVDVKLGKPSLVGSPSKPRVPGMVDQVPWAVEGPAALLQNVLLALPANMAIAQLKITIPPPGANDADRAPRFHVQGILYVQAQ